MNGEVDLGLGEVGLGGLTPLPGRDGLRFLPNGGVELSSDSPKILSTTFNVAVKTFSSSFWNGMILDRSAFKIGDNKSFKSCLKDSKPL